MDLRSLSLEEIINLLREKKIGAAELTDNGICPTCFNHEHDGVVFGKDDDKMLFENDEFECFLAGNPRANGHTVIATKKHYKDMMAIEDDVCERAFVLAKKAMNAVKEVYGAESVYLCTMCDGPMNHFHLQLIPRYANEKRGSKNFVKERFDYVEDKEKLLELRKKMGYKQVKSR